MTKDTVLEDAQIASEKFKEEQIKEWVQNGASLQDAEQFFDEMINDSNYTDPDMDVYSDYSINERINQYSKI
jgi:hypothetical protein